MYIIVSSLRFNLIMIVTSTLQHSNPIESIKKKTIRTRQRLHKHYQKHKFLIAYPGLRTSPKPKRLIDVYGPRSELRYPAAASEGQGPPAHHGAPPASIWPKAGPNPRMCRHLSTTKRRRGGRRPRHFCQKGKERVFDGDDRGGRVVAIAVLRL